MDKLNQNIRPRRLRKSAAIRDMVQENHIGIQDLIAPLFVVDGKGVKEGISSMPGYYRYSLDLQLEKLKIWVDAGLRSALLFVKVEEDLKDNTGKASWDENGLMQKAIQSIKSEFPELCLMTDVALDPYSSYGHDGIVREGEIVNDETVEALIKMGLSHAKAGADFLAPSDMMDGRVGAIRKALDAAGYTGVGIMSYAAKYASCFYGPFRDALDSAPGFGDKKTYQMNPANKKEALREIELDIQEGADILMVKPGMPYLDVVHMVKEHADLPVAAYQVSGEYAMIKAAGERGWLNEKQAMHESLLAFKRAGADLIATYFIDDFINI